MKKGWKIFWIVCASIGVIGLALTITGVAMGATLQDAFLYAHNQDFDDYDVLDDFDDSNDVDYDDMYDDEDDIHDSSEHNSSADNSTSAITDSSKLDSLETFRDISSIDMEVTCLEVKVQEYDGDGIKVDSSDVSSRLGLTVTPESDDDGAELVIRTNNKIPGNHDQGNLIIYLPKDQILDEVGLGIGAGTLDIDAVNARSLDIDCGAGTANITNFNVEDLDLDCGAGEAIARGAASNELDIKCGLGQVNLILTGKVTDYNYDVQCGAGSVNLDKDSYSGLGVSKSINNNASAECDIDCGLGEVDVAFQD